jgi:hypothetical protein
MQKITRAVGLMIVGLCMLWAFVLVARAELETQNSIVGAVNFAPGRSQTIVKSIYAVSDSATGTLTPYVKGSSGKTALTATPTNNQSVISVLNTSYTAAAGLTTNDLVMYVHSDGTCDYRTISAAASNSVTLSSGISLAGTASDYIYELVAQTPLNVAFAGAGPGTNDVLNMSGEAVYASPGNSPVRFVLTGSATTNLTVTVDK